MKIHGSEFFSDDPQDRLRAYELTVANKFHSKWDFLRTGTASSIATAGNATCDLINLWHDCISRKERPAVTHLLVTDHYCAFVYGPVSSSVLLSCLSIESFARLAHAVWLMQELADIKAVRSRFGYFDKLPFIDKLRTLCQELSGKPLNRRLESRLTSLRDFRNAAAHDDPDLMLKQWQRIPIKKSKKEEVEPKYFGAYPALDATDGGMPLLNFYHGLTAIRTHDDFVTDVFEKARSGFIRSFERNYREEFSNRLLIGSKLPPRAMEPEIIAEILRGWQAMAQWRNAVAPQDREELYRELLRSVTIKPVP